MSAQPPQSVNAAAALTRYGTPLAITLIVQGLYVAVPAGSLRKLCVGLVLTCVFFNIGMLYFIMRLDTYRHMIIRVRVVFNLIFNVLLVYLLGGYWPPIWLLLSLTPIATAIYGTLVETIVAAVGTCVLFLAIYVAQINTGSLIGVPTAGFVNLGLNEQIAYGIYTFFLGLIIHGIVNDVRSSSLRTS
jgi:hypothetical protein